MRSKILIDVNEDGIPVLRIIKPLRSASENDVRDKLLDRFTSGYPFAMITHPDEHSTEPDIEIFSMGTMDILENILNMFKPMIMDSETEKDFEQSIYKVASILESSIGLKSTSFLTKCKAESLVYGDK